MYIYIYTNTYILSYTRSAPGTRNPEDEYTPDIRRISALRGISALQRKFSVTSRMEARETMQNKTILFR